jgi:hypothetical protein
MATKSDLFLYEEASADSQFRFSAVVKSGKSEGTLKKLAPGHYQAALPISAPDDYRIELTEERRSRRIDYPLVGYILPYDPRTEVTRPDFNTDLLVQLAQVTGVEINPQTLATDTKQTVTQNYQPIRQPLIVLAFVLFLLEIVTRRLLLSEID